MTVKVIYEDTFKARFTHDFIFRIYTIMSAVDTIFNWMTPTIEIDIVTTGTTYESGTLTATGDNLL